MVMRSPRAMVPAGISPARASGTLAYNAARWSSASPRVSWQPSTLPLSSLTTANPLQPSVSLLMCHGIARPSPGGVAAVTAASRENTPSGSSPSGQGITNPGVVHGSPEGAGLAAVRLAVVTAPLRALRVGLPLRIGVLGGTPVPPSGPPATPRDWLKASP